MLALAIVGGFFLDFTAQLAFAQPAPPPLNLTGSAPITVTPSGAGNLARVIACPTCGASSGNVTGPNSSVTGDIAVYADTTGKVLADGGTVFPIPASGSTQSVARVTVNGTNGGLALVPNGSGAVMAAIPDGTAAGGNARGAGAIDLQMFRSAATSVASGNTSVALGKNNTASGNGSAAIGWNNTASGANSYAAGSDNTASGQNASAIGEGGTADGSYSFVIGNRGVARGNDGAMIHGGDNGGSAGMQGEEYIFHGATSGATALRLTTSGGAATATNVAALANFSAGAFTITFTAYDVDAPGAAAFTVTGGIIMRGANAAATTLSGTFVAGATTGSPPALAANPTVVADTVNGGFDIEVTPPVSNTQRWKFVAVVRFGLGI
jgi:hypothetical protein